MSSFKLSVSSATVVAVVRATHTPLVSLKPLEHAVQVLGSPLHAVHERSQATHVLFLCTVRVPNGHADSHCPLGVRNEPDAHAVQLVAERGTLHSKQDALHSPQL